jgi:hypothetical protein
MTSTSWRAIRPATDVRRACVGASFGRQATAVSGASLCGTEDVRAGSALQRVPKRLRGVPVATDVRRGPRSMGERGRAF